MFQGIRNKRKKSLRLRIPLRRGEPRYSAEGGDDGGAYEDGPSICLYSLVSEVLLMNLICGFVVWERSVL